jgi:hypothetical protein
MKLYTMIDSSLTPPNINDTQNCKQMAIPLTFYIWFTWLHEIVMQPWETRFTEKKDHNINFVKEYAMNIPTKCVQLVPWS